MQTKRRWAHVRWQEPRRPRRPVWAGEPGSPAAARIVSRGSNLDQSLLQLFSRFVTLLQTFPLPTIPFCANIVDRIALLAWEDIEWVFKDVACFESCHLLLGQACS